MLGGNGAQNISPTRGMIIKGGMLTIERTGKVVEKLNGKKRKFKRNLLALEVGMRKYEWGGLNYNNGFLKNKRYFREEDLYISR